MKDLWLDCNAHIPLLSSALKAYSDFNNSKAGRGNPSSPSAPGKDAAIALEIARNKIAQLIGAKTSSQIIFTSSATQACQWAVNILFKKSNVFVSPVEHNAVIDATSKLSNYLEINSDGLVIDRRKLGAVACIYVQSEIGTIQPIDELNCDYIFSDMTQSLGKIPVDVTKLGIDIAAFGAHKFGGPTGVGFLYLKDTFDWTEFGTGSRYYMDYPGTPNVGGVVATAAALEEAINSLPERNKNMLKFRSTLENGLKELKFEIIGEKTNRVPNTTFVKVPCNSGNCGMILLLQLGNVGVHVGLGSACGSMYTGGSPLMKALNRPSDGQEYIRISQWGQYGTEEAKCVLKNIEKCLKN